MKDKQMEKFIDACYDVMFQREAEMEELGLLNYGDSSYYIQNPDEYEKDKKICELENEVERLKLYEKALFLATEQISEFQFGCEEFNMCQMCSNFGAENCADIECEDGFVNYFLNKAKEMLKDE